MKKVLEEFGKWFINSSIGILIALIVQPIAQGKFDKHIALLGAGTICLFLFFGDLLLFLSAKAGGEE